MLKIEGGDEKGVEQEVQGTKETFERSNEEASCSQEKEGPAEDSQHQEKDSPTVETQDPVLPEVEEKPSDDVAGGAEQAEEKEEADTIDEIGAEVQAAMQDQGGFMKELD